MEIEAGGTTVEDQSKFRSSLGYRRPIVKVIVIIIKMKFTGKMDTFAHQKSSYLIA